jgi:phosphatidate cytidylyltransferase
MSDDIWRRGERGDDRTGEFGPPLFGDESEPADGTGDDTGERRLSFGPNDTGPLPHWTDPPTGELPNVEPAAPVSASAGGGGEEDVDVWSSFTTESPIWRDDAAATDPSGGTERDATGEVGAPYDFSESYERRRASTGEVPAPGAPPARREPGRITIGTDPSGAQRRSPPGRRRAGGPPRSGRPAGPARTSSKSPVSPRNLPAAIATGAVLAAAFVIATLWKPVAVLVIIVIVLAIGAFEYFGKVTEKGYRPVVASGLAACVAAPLAAYWLGVGTLPLVLAFAFIAGALSFIGASSVESGPLPNMAITTMGVTWIGLLGSYAALILRFSNEPVSGNIGTDTLFLVVLGVVANDVGAMFIGSAAGRTLLRPWISPGKSVEGLIGGTVMTIVVLLVIGIGEFSDTWSSTVDLLLLGVVIAIASPLGDLTESMLKRNLDVKDFGTLVSGHGGVLDRFDGMLFALPAAYYLMLVLEPWTS